MQPDPKPEDDGADDPVPDESSVEPSEVPDTDTTDEEEVL